MTQITERPAMHTILILDDEEHIRAALFRALRRDGYNVVLAASPSEAVEALNSHAPGVVISDYRMPEMVGTEFLARARDRFPDSMRILLTAQADEEAVAKAMATGAVHKMLEKPWDDEALRALVREAFVTLEAGAA